MNDYNYQANEYVALWGVYRPTQQIPAIPN